MQGAGQTDKHLLCPRCATSHPMRMRREGLLRRFIMPYLGLYPWKCGNCSHIFVAHERGNMRKQRRSSAPVA